MNSISSCFSHKISRFAIIGLLFALPASAGVVFTNDTIINAFDTNYDGNDLVVSNCTLAVDGTHGFLSLQVGPGGTLTHSYSSNGNIIVLRSITNEAQTLIGTTPVTLQSAGTLISQTVTDTGSSLIYTQDVDYVMLLPGGGVIEIARTAESSIPDGTTVLVSYTVQVTTPAGLTLSVTGDVQVMPGGVINVAGRGYGGGNGNGAGHSSASFPSDGSGGGYGGIGGTSSSNAVGGVSYGLFDQPANLGGSGGNSSGGTGASGGGLIKLVAGGTINIDGAIYANGLDATNSRAGGGSGGGIWLSAATVSGAGLITANGGAGEPVHGGGGGGGRIYIQANTLSFSGSTTAFGGNGAQYGGAGTIYTKLTGQTGLVVVDNGGRTGTNSPLTVANSADVVVRGNAGVLISNPWSVRNIVVASNSLVLGPPQGTLNINAVNLTVDAGGTILADQMGYAPGGGPGAGGYYPSGSLYPCGGGAHGGYGGGSVMTSASGGVAYDELPGATSAGSGGGYNINPTVSLSGYGGGIISLIASGAMQINGKISANGGAGSGNGGGGGAGGGIALSVRGNFSGSGLISANGGNGAAAIGGGGGGGRISISAYSNSFTGALMTYGGTGANTGGAGTVYLSTPKKQIIADNGGRLGTNTSIIFDSYSELIVRNGAVAVTASPTSFAGLLLGSNGWITATALFGTYAGQVNLNINGSATIQAGGGIFVDAMGSSGGSGPGAGRSYPNGSSYYLGGAGHGGYGGGTSPSYPIAGNAYDLTANPNQSGSGGGQYLPNYVGGWGGGYVRLNVTGTLQMDGRLSANGGNGSGLGGGGGSGGTVWLSAGAFSGTGTISANGGSSALTSSTGGGGGGGRVCIVFYTNRFNGAISAYGGGWTNVGGAGTIYLKTNLTPYAVLLVDNGGIKSSTNSAVSGDFNGAMADLTVSGGAIAVLPASSWTIHNVQVRSNAALVPSTSTSAQNFMVLGNATVDLVVPFRPMVRDTVRAPGPAPVSAYTVESAVAVAMAALVP